MRLKIYNAIIARLRRIIVKDGLPYFPVRQEATEGQETPDPAIFTFDLWNENLATLNKQRPIRTPAVFIEFLPITWQQLGNRAKRADVQVRLHIVTATMAPINSQFTDEALYRFRLIQAIELALVGMTGDADDRGLSFGHCTHTESSTDHNHEQVCIDIEGWKVPAIDQSAVIQRWRMTPDPVTLNDGMVFAGQFDDPYV